MTSNLTKIQINDTTSYIVGYADMSTTKWTMGGLELVSGSLAKDSWHTYSLVGSMGMYSQSEIDTAKNLGATQILVTVSGGCTAPDNGTAGVAVYPGTYTASSANLPREFRIGRCYSPDTYNQLCGGTALVPIPIDDPNITLRTLDADKSASCQLRVHSFNFLFPISTSTNGIDYVKVGDTYYTLGRQYNICYLNKTCYSGGLGADKNASFDVSGYTQAYNVTQLHFSASINNTNPGTNYNYYQSMYLYPNGYDVDEYPMNVCRIRSMSNANYWTGGSAVVIPDYWMDTITIRNTGNYAYSSGSIVLKWIKWSQKANYGGINKIQVNGKTYPLKSPNVALGAWVYQSYSCFAGATIGADKTYKYVADLGLSPNCWHEVTLTAYSRNVSSSTADTTAFAIWVHSTAANDDDTTYTDYGSTCIGRLRTWKCLNKAANTATVFCKSNSSGKIMIVMHNTQNKSGNCGLYIAATRCIGSSINMVKSLDDV